MVQQTATKKSRKIDPEELLEQAESLSSLPASAHRVMEVASDESSDAADIEQVVSTDPTLTATLLRVVNSACYGFSDPVANVRRAIVILGFSTVRSLVMSISVCNLFRSSRNIGSYSRPGLWHHSVAVGVTAKMMCRRFGIGSAEQAFVGGMLHDIGIIVEDQYAHDAFVEVMLTAQQSEENLWGLERRILGTDHAALGRELSKRWRFPDDVAVAPRRRSSSDFSDKQFGPNR